MENKFAVRVYYEDTDAGGVVYHSNYLKFAERARTELLRENGFSQHELMQHDLAFVVHHMSIDFRQPAVLDDSLIIKTKIKELKRVSLVFFQSIYHENGTLLCELTVNVACVKLLNKKPRAIPTEIIRKLTGASC